MVAFVFFSKDLNKTLEEKTPSSYTKTPSEFTPRYISLYDAAFPLLSVCSAF